MKYVNLQTLMPSENWLQNSKRSFYLSCNERKWLSFKPFSNWSIPFYAGRAKTLNESNAR